MISKIFISISFLGQPQSTDKEFHSQQVLDRHLQTHEDGEDGGHWSVRHHHHRRLRREMQEKENCCNIGGIEGVTAQLANFQRT